MKKIFVSLFLLVSIHNLHAAEPACDEGTVSTCEDMTINMEITGTTGPPYFGSKDVSVMLSGCNEDGQHTKMSIRLTSMMENHTTIEMDIVSRTNCEMNGLTLVGEKNDEQQSNILTLGLGNGSTWTGHMSTRMTGEMCGNGPSRGMNLVQK